MSMITREMIKLLNQNGFEVVSQNDSHTKMKNHAAKCQAIIPYYSQSLKKELKTAIIKAVMNKLFYPSIFHKAEEAGFWGSFPDLPECLTEGDNMEQAYEMAVDALGLALTRCESRDADKNKIMKINEAWEDLKSEPNENIQSEKGILNRQIRSIQTEEHFVDIKENENFKRFHHGSSEKALKEFLLYAIGRNINKYHRFLSGERKKFEGKTSLSAA